MCVNPRGHILFYDGVCGLCDRLVQFVLRRDRAQRFRFAALQGEAAAQTLAFYGRDPTVLDTVYVLTDEVEPRLLTKGRAIAFVLRELGGGWRLLSWLTRLVPAAALDWGYDRVARNRYRMFGKREACRLPSAEEKLRFLG